MLFDVLGDEGTIHEVLHLDRTPEDYAKTLSLLREVGVPVAPHVVKYRGSFYMCGNVAEAAGKAEKA